MFIDGDFEGTKVDNRAQIFVKALLEELQGAERAVILELGS